MGFFDPVIGMDMYYIYTAALVMVMGIICDTKQQAANKNASSPAKTTPQDGPSSSGLAERIAKSRTLLRACAELGARCLQNDMMPGTNRRYCVVMGDLDGMTNDFIAKVTGGAMASTQQSAAADANQSYGGASYPFDKPGGNLAATMAAQPADGSHGIVEAGAEDFGWPPHGEGMYVGGDMAQQHMNFGFADSAWTWQDGHWNDIATMLLGNNYPGQ